MDLTKPEFPRASAYPAELVLGGNMGPNPLWLAEWLLRDVELEEGARVLDLGSGMGASSIFLARETGARVFAADLWTTPDDAWSRVVAQGLEDRVVPVRAEAHALPFAAGFFDAVVSFDAYQYFGGDPMYLFYLARFLRPGGRIGVVVPGLMQPLPPDGPPPHLTEPQSHGVPFWEEECMGFSTADEWRAVFARCPRVEVQAVDTLEDGWRHWRDWERATEGSGPFPSAAEALDRDAGRYLGFIRVIATRREGEPGMDLYEPGLAERVRSG
ncbi:MAG TPA: methyltransferase domain-containing protein [Sandaracinaceae bacterium LLY-WYZ-13_1]|nr:methyltransferase domain-containing protein [Sandaracinaceae bacterium LLY-WYZ-13_1]